MGSHAGLVEKDGRIRKHLGFVCSFFKVKLTSDSSFHTIRLGIMLSFIFLFVKFCCSAFHDPYIHVLHYILEYNGCVYSEEVCNALNNIPAKCSRSLQVNQITTACSFRHTELGLSTVFFPPFIQKN